MTDHLNYLIFFAIIAILIIVVKSTRTVLKASKRINLLYDYFIIRQKASKNDLISMAKAATQDPNNNDDDSDGDDTIGPDPNDGSGCPDEEELMKND